MNTLSNKATFLGEKYQFWLWVFLLLVMFAPMDMYLSGANPDGTGDPTPYTRYFRYGCGFFSLLLLIKHCRTAIHIISNAWSMGVWVSILVLSLYSAFSINTSLIQLTSFFTLLAICLAMVVANSTANLIKIFVWGMLLCVGLSYLFIIFIPSYGVHQAGDILGKGEVGFWRGAFIHKNNFGHFLAFAFLGILFGGRSVLRRGFYILAIILILLASFQSHCSTTPIMIFAGLIGYLIGWILGSMRNSLAILMSFILLALLYVTQSIAIRFTLALTGKDETLSGRKVFWDYGEQLLNQRPLLGWGYGYTWSPDVMDELDSLFGYTHFHNGFLELAINCGYFSLVGLTLIILHTFIQSLAGIKSRANGATIGLFMALLFSWCTSCMTEPAGLRNYGVPASVGLFAMMSLLCRRKLRQQLT